MTKQYNSPTFPPKGPWDARLEGPACTELTPVEEIHSNPWFAVNERGSFFTIEYHQPQVIVLPVLENHSFIMVRPYRPVVKDSPLEFPAGAVEKGEKPVEGAMRELAEESGIQIDSSRFVTMAPLALSPNRTPKLTYIFRVDVRQQEYDERGDFDNEIEAIEVISLREAAEAVVSGGIYISIPVAIIGMYLLERSLLGIDWKNKDSA
jgi:ADP-ribose pyrophosphatase